ncbi:ActR/RegA family two-component response regulator [Rhodopseudomonas rhenobacensis]|uniref:ActR/RegA family two-component response regulator n=1 Tax=Rhodopseudomonas rhenobacensis TaxID=87461 RepID=A0A7W7Z143_9BRAD|nr:response regulator [Rhodopseudomonas rhenobacensis]MBB5045974.1 ActR/RegA family two-component response regulator [Rhodopseudomonas rhenobacensis]
MKVVPSVLVVEDDEVLREAYAKNIERAGCLTDQFPSKEAAIEAARSKIYSVALVDIMLTTDDPDDRSGFDVIKTIRDLGEGTRCIAISGYPGYAAPAEAVNLGVNYYIPKAEIYDPPDYVRPIQTELSKCELRRFGEFASLIDYIAAQCDYHIWEGLSLRELGVNASEFHQLLNSAITPLCPLLPAIGGTIAGDVGAGMVQLTGWSKVIGAAVNVVLSRDAGAFESEGGADLTERFKEFYCLIKRRDEARSSFILRAADVKRRKRSRDRGRSTMA